MYTGALRRGLTETRIEDLRRARGTSSRPHRSREHRSRRAAARWGLLGGAGRPRSVFATPPRATWGPRS